MAIVVGRVSIGRVPRLERSTTLCHLACADLSTREDYGVGGAFAISGYTSAPRSGVFVAGTPTAAAMSLGSGWPLASAGDVASSE